MSGKCAPQRTAVDSGALQAPSRAHPALEPAWVDTT